MLSLRCKLCALGVGAEPGFNEKVGDYGAWGAVGSPGSHLYASLPTHMTLRGQLQIASKADVATVMSHVGGGGGTSLWINSNCDHAMEEFAKTTANSYLIPISSRSCRQRDASQHRLPRSAWLRSSVARSPMADHSNLAYSRHTQTRTVTGR